MLHLARTTALLVVVGLAACTAPTEADSTLDQASYLGDLGVGLGSPVTTSSTTGLTNDYQPACAYSAAPDAAYTWTAPAAGSYTFSTAGSGFDTVLDVRQYNTGASLGCNDDSGGTLQSSVTAFVVGRNGRASGHNMILGPGGSSPNNQLRWESPTQALFVTQNAGTIIYSPMDNTTVYHALSLRYDGTTLTFYSNGVAKSSSAFTASSPWTIASVGSWYSSDYLLGDLAELVIYDRPLTETERATVNSYLRTKYAL